jgi:hypothetical protein
MTEEEEKNSRSRQVFISYARADDEPFVKRLYDDLEKEENYWSTAAQRNNQVL